MQYSSEIIKDGIKLHFNKATKYKTNLITIFMTVPLDRETVTKNALIASILRLGTNNLKTQEEISKKLEDMYGAEFNCGIEKLGSNQIVKFYLETLNEKFIPKQENLLEDALSIIIDIAFNPLVENGGFSEQYINTEKVNLKNIIESKINDKDQYSFDRCIEEMYKDDAYSIYKYGYVEDIDKINSKDLYNQYLNLINTAKIDIYVSGDFEDNKVKQIVNKNEFICRLNDRDTSKVVVDDVPKAVSNEARRFEEKSNVTQGKLVLGLDIDDNSPDSKYVLAIYNVIFGASPTSKLFQNVREKASLAYTARSMYIRQKNNIFIRCGIEIDNYEKAVNIINEQLEEMKNGNFTDEDINIAKRSMVSAIKAIQDEQDTELTYLISQELSGKEPNYQEYIDKVNSVSKQQVVDIAKKISVNMIYFLTK